jgi:hypothetical protein
MSKPQCPFTALRAKLKIRPETFDERESYFYTLLNLGSAWWHGLDAKPEYDESRPGHEVVRLLRLWGGISCAPAGPILAALNELEPTPNRTGLRAPHPFLRKNNE